MVAIPLRERLRGFLVDELTARRFLSDDEPLFSTGILDSMNLVRLLAFLEDDFGIRVLPSDVSPDHFDTVAGIARYLEQKLKREEK